MIWDIIFSVVISGVLNFWFSDVLLMLKNMENIIICRILLFVIVLVMLVGMVCERNVFRVMLLMVSLVFIVLVGIVRFRLLSGCFRVIINSFISIESIDELINYIIVLLFMWLIVEVLFIFIMLIVSVLKINGVIIILISCRKILVRSVMLFDQVLMVFVDVYL